MKSKYKSISSKQARDRLKINFIKTITIADAMLQVTVKSGEISEVKANGTPLIKHSRYMPGTGSIFADNGRLFGVRIKNKKLVAEEITIEKYRSSKDITNVIGAEELYPKRRKRSVKP